METPSRVELAQVIYVSTFRGDNTPSNPLRCVSQYWSLDGHLLAESDGLFEFPDLATHYAYERLMQLRGITIEVAPYTGLVDFKPGSAACLSGAAPEHSADAVVQDGSCDDGEVHHKARMNELVARMQANQRQLIACLERREIAQ